MNATGAKSGYEAQWGVWSYVGGSKTAYDSLQNIQGNVSAFFNRAEQIARETGQRVEDVIPELSAQESRLNVQLGDPRYVTTQIGLASDRLKDLPVGAPWSVIKTKAPQLEALARQAGVKIEGGVKTGLGFWREGDKVDFEKNFNLVVSGSKSAVEWFAAAMGKMEPSAYGDSQAAVLVTHYGIGGETPAIKLPVKGLDPEAAETVANRLIDHVNGFDMGWENVRSGQGHVHMVGLDEGGQPLDPAEFQMRVNKVAQAMRELGITTTGSTEVQLADARVIHAEDYDRIIRGGPRGAFSSEDYRAVESAPNDGGAGDRSPPGGARSAEGGSASTALGDNHGNPVVPPEEDGLTHLHAGLPIAGRHIAGGLAGAAIGNISTPTNATDEERHQRIAAGAAAGLLGTYFAKPLGRAALRVVGEKATSEVASRMGDLGYRWNRALAPLKNLTPEARGAFVEFGNRLLQNKQMAETMELEGEKLFGRTGSATNGLDQAMEFEETGGLRGATSAQEAYLDKMRRFSRASNSIGRAKGFIFGDVTEPRAPKTAIRRGDLGETQDRVQGLRGGNRPTDATRFVDRPTTTSYDDMAITLAQLKRQAVRRDPNAWRSRSSSTNWATLVILASFLARATSSASFEDTGRSASGAAVVPSSSNLPYATPLLRGHCPASSRL